MAELPFPELKKQGAPGAEAPKPEAKKKPAGGLFAGKPKALPIDIQKQISSLTNMINDLGRRLRVLEEKFNNMDKKVKLNEENVLSNFKKVNTSLATFHDDINEFRQHIKIDDERTELIIKELKLSAKKEDLAVLQRYIELWDPVKFATHTEIEKVIEEKINEKIGRTAQSTNITKKKT